MNIISKIIADKILRTPLNHEDEKHLHDWLNEDERNVECFNRIQSGEFLKMMAELEEQEIGRKLAKKIIPIINRRKKKAVLYSVAATVAAAIVFSFVIFNNEKHVDKQAYLEPIKITIDSNNIRLITSQGEEIDLEKDSIKNDIIKQGKGASLIAQTANIEYNTIIVPNKKSYDIILPDGTHVWINAGSKLIYPTNFNDTLREVELIGEAFFEVTKRKTIPFVVKTKLLNTKVLGTKFMVTSYDDAQDYQVSLVEGKVNVTSRVSNDNTTITKGHGVKINADSKEYNVIDINIDEIYARTKGHFIFDAIPLSEIIGTLKRWYDVEFICDKELLDNRFYLKAKKYDNIDDIMMLLKETKKIDYTISENTITLKKVMPMN